MHNNRKNYDNLYVSNIFLNKKIKYFTFTIPSQPILTQTYYSLNFKITYKIKHFLCCFISITAMILNNLR